MSKPARTSMATAVTTLALALAAPWAAAQNGTTTTTRPSPMAMPAASGAVGTTPMRPMRPMTPGATILPATTPAARADAPSKEDSEDAVKHVNKSMEVVRMMNKDPKLKALLAQSKGVLIVPDYGRAALGVGAQGGAGTLMVHKNGKWTGPGFYNMGGVSIGLQAGVSAGQIALVLMNDKAVNSFGQNNKFSLNADAGLTIVNWSQRAHGTSSRGDVVVYSETEGAFANLSFSVTDMNFDEEETQAYYGKPVTPQMVTGGTVTNAKAKSLAMALGS